jgi:NYN domain
MSRVACYVDGFNLYHAINDLGKPHLKWLNLRLLAESLCRPGEMLTQVSYFSAYATWLPGPYGRHRLYVKALQTAQIECHIARFNERNCQCRKCGVKWKEHEEKETDVHFSMTLLEDAIDDVFDRAIIISADGDHVPPVRRIRNRLPGKEMFLATPPNRYGHARELLKVCNSGTAITAGRLAKSLFPEQITDAAGNILVSRPAEYAPPT